MLYLIILVLLPGLHNNQGEELWSAKRLPNKRPAKIYIDYHGKKVTFAELSTLTGISISTLGIRYHRGYQGEELWSTKRLTSKGKCRSEERRLGKECPTK